MLAQEMVCFDIYQNDLTLLQVLYCHRVGVLSTCANKIQRNLFCKIALYVKCMSLVTINTGCAVVDSIHWDSMICSNPSYKDKILCVEQETCNAEDCFAKHFTVSIVKA